MTGKKCLICFIKYPEPGKVKTRIARDLGEKEAADIYSNFVLDTIELIEKADAQKRIFYAPEEKCEEIKNWLGNKYSYHPQKGADLGTKMKNAFLRSFVDGFKSIVIIGSDSPDLPPGILKEAFAGLKKSNCVIGPAQDGGYYLIGFNKSGFEPAVFDRLEWGTGEVFKKTLDILNKAGCGYKKLPLWRDADDVDDLKALILRNKEDQFKSSNTFKAVSEILRGVIYE